ncbi:fkbp-type peptidyl-prolyl [Moniliophthora roreri MCA 2997]|uniref:peptidylprolyl isomerase n=1 Tax=Moniliophthora roreri (strain MCA 2997) TaxID=1381753 RepID=V2YZ97_MONRO|nr:fkbp-type peptidyl-prolyl [Moniliophthora roreri MCA 2997]
MSVAVGLWTHALVPGEKEVVVPSADLKITNAALGDVLADENSRTSVKLVFRKIVAQEDSDNDAEENEEDSVPTSTTFVCSLTPGKVEQAVLDIILMDEEEYLFEVVGKNTVYLTGYYIDQSSDQPPYDLDGMDSDDDNEDAYDLREVSSDVEMHPDELDGMESDASRFEEVKEDAPKGNKRPRESDATPEKTTPKTEKKKKKQKLDTDGANEKAEKEKSEKKKEKAKEEKATERELPGGLKIKDSKIGTGPAAKKGQTISMRYIGKLQNGKTFDSNTKGKPFTFHLGRGEVIKGWDEGLVGIQVGGERILTIPPAMAYGKKGTDGIPGNSTLTFEVKCVKIN